MAVSVSMRTKVNKKKLDGLIQKMPDQAAQAVAKTALFWQNEAASNITRYDAIDTGTMRATTQAVPVSDYEWKLTSPMEYAPYVNYGTYRMAARPFFDEAIETTQEYWLKQSKAIMKP